MACDELQRDPQELLADFTGYFPITSRWRWYDYALDDFKVRWDGCAMLLEDLLSSTGIATVRKDPAENNG